MNNPDNARREFWERCAAAAAAAGPDPDEAGRMADAMIAEWDRRFFAAPPSEITTEEVSDLERDAFAAYENALSHYRQALHLIVNAPNFTAAQEFRRIARDALSSTAAATVEDRETAAVKEGATRLEAMIYRSALQDIVRWARGKDAGPYKSVGLRIEKIESRATYALLKGEQK